MNKNTEIYNLNGRLELKEDADYEYILKDGNIECNLSEILHNATKIEKPVMYMEITIKGRQVLNEEGYFYETPDGDNVVSCFIEGENIDKFLFDHTGQRMNIYIKTWEDTEAVK